jgi:hypothetical protein
LFGHGTLLLHRMQTGNSLKAHVSLLMRFTVQFNAALFRLSTAIWEQTFSFPLLNEFAAEKCPMLLGITRRSPGRKRWMPAVEYQFMSLLKGDTLIRTQEKATLDTLLPELMSFKEQCDAIELALASSYEVPEPDMALNVDRCKCCFSFRNQNERFCRVYNICRCL